MFSSLISSIKSWCANLTEPLKGLFGRSVIDEGALQELHSLLIAADVGSITANHIIQQLKTSMSAGKKFDGDDLRRELHQIILPIVSRNISLSSEQARIIFLVGVNGSGKTTTAAKLAHAAQRNNKRVLLVAADTFRAAAIEQLLHWGNRLHIPVVSGDLKQDPASVVFKGCEAFRAGLYDLMIIDTAGRLQTKSHLMSELAKLRKVISKQLPHERVETLLSIDSMLGQNSLYQARIFHESTNLNGIILTKMDGYGRGGIVLSISDQLGIPVRYITTGEEIEKLEIFNPELFVSTLLQE